LLLDRRFVSIVALRSGVLSPSVLASGVVELTLVNAEVASFQTAAAYVPVFGFCDD
jgi:hypothetical protein